MARIRSLKPEFFINEQLATVPFEWRLLFAGLWTQADRNGRLEDRPMRLKATLFPYDDLDINDGLGCLANAGLITRYERDGANYIAIPTWLKHQQPHVKEVAGKIPAPVGEQEPGGSTVPAPGKHGASTPDQGADPDPDPEQHNPRAQGALDVLDVRFERFWAAYPRKVGKDAARAVWMRRKPTEALTVEILTAIERQSKTTQWRRDGGQFIPHPRTWLSQGRWQDAEESISATEKPFTPGEEKHAIQVRRGMGRCLHDPPCDSYAACLATIIRYNREKAKAS